MNITPATGIANVSVPAAREVPPQQAATNRSIVQAVKAVNTTDMFGEGNHLAFQRDPETQRMVIQVINSQTHEVVLQIPPEYVLALAEDLKQQEANANPTKDA
jgi:uncharacterized FlaG/YvyC family protein